MGIYYLKQNGIGTEKFGIGIEVCNKLLRVGISGRYSDLFIPEHKFVLL